MKRVALSRRAPLRARRRHGPRVPLDVQAIVTARADGRCEKCGRRLTPGLLRNFHHRRPAKSGGTRAPDFNTPANVVLICGHGNALPGCHRDVETVERARSYETGWLVRACHDPTTVPLTLWRSPWPLLLTLDGQVRTP